MLHTDFVGDASLVRDTQISLREDAPPAYFLFCNIEVRGPKLVVVVSRNWVPLSIYTIHFHIAALVHYLFCMACIKNTHLLHSIFPTNYKDRVA